MTKLLMNTAHFFSSEDAVKYSMEAAIIKTQLSRMLSNLQGKDIVRDQYGTPGVIYSYDELHEIFPYFNKNHIRRYVQRLCEKGISICPTKYRGEDVVFVEIPESIAK